MTSSPQPQSDITPETLAAALAKTGYLADDELVLIAWLAMKLERPLMLEGPAGVGKTDFARAVATGLDRPFFRLQCYEGLDESKALYEWDYAKQMLYTQLLRGVADTQTNGVSSIGEAIDRLGATETAFFSKRFLIARPLLAALSSEKPAVLLIDEVDRADPEFEAFLLEMLAENQVSIPEIGTIRPTHPPFVVLTTNATREMTDALRRRCAHAFLDYPPPSRELAIIKARVPGISEKLAADLTAVASNIRKMALRKSPSISEAIDWGRALVTLGANALDKKTAVATLGLFLKHDEDRRAVAARIDAIVPDETKRSA